MTIASRPWRSSGGREYREGYTTIRHRDLETRYLYREAVASRPRHRREDRARAEGRLRDGCRRRRASRPRAVRRRPFNSSASRISPTGDLSRFDAIMTGTRAYAVRDGPQDLQPPAARLREERRQPDRALQHAGVRAEPVRAVSGRRCPQAPKRFRRRTRRSTSSRPTDPVLTRRTGSPRPTSTAGWSSAVRNSGTTWDPQYTP